MPLKIVRKNQVDIPGRGYMLLTAPHAIRPGADLYMGQIVEDAALLSKSFAVIGKAGKEFDDPVAKQIAQSEFTESIQTFVQEDGLKCILDIRAKIEPGVSISLARDESASQSTTDLIKTRLASDFRLNVRVGNALRDLASSGIALSNRGPDDNFALEEIRIEFGLEEKTLNSGKIIRGLADIVGLINQKAGHLESDEGAGDTLD